MLWVRRTLWVVRDGNGAAGHVSVARFDISDLHEAEAKHDEAESMVRSLIDNSSEIIAVIEPDGQWRWTSGAMTRTLGHPQHVDPDANGVFGLVHPDDRLKVAEALDALKERRLDPEHIVELRVAAADGSWRTLETRGRNLVDDPAVRGLVLFSRDVTQRRIAEQQVLQLRDVLAASTDLVFISDPSGTIEYANAPRHRSPRDTQGRYADGATRSIRHGGIVRRDD